MERISWQALASTVLPRNTLMGGCCMCCYPESAGPLFSGNAPVEGSLRSSALPQTQQPIRTEQFSKLFLELAPWLPPNLHNIKRETRPNQPNNSFLHGISCTSAWVCLSAGTSACEGLSRILRINRNFIRGFPHAQAAQAHPSHIVEPASQHISKIISFRWLYIYICLYLYLIIAETFRRE